MHSAVGMIYAFLKPGHLHQQGLSHLFLRQAFHTIPALGARIPPQCNSGCQNFFQGMHSMRTGYSWVENGNKQTCGGTSGVVGSLSKAQTQTYSIIPSLQPSNSHSQTQIRAYTSSWWPSGGQRFPFPINFTNCVIGVNIAAFIAQHLTNDYLTVKLMKSSWHIDHGELWRLITPVFLHGDFWHLLINSYSLYNLGTSLEPTTGMPRFATIYFVSALAGNLFSYWYNHNNSVGASTALFGLLGAEAMIYWRNQHVLQNSASNLQNIALMLAINAAYGMSNPRIDNSGHFGGFIGGLVASYLLGPAYVRGRWGGYQDKPPIDIFTKK